MKFPIILALLAFSLSVCGPLVRLTSEAVTTQNIDEYQDFAYDIVWSQDDSMVALTTLTGLYVYDTKMYKQVFAFEKSGGTSSTFGGEYIAAIGNDGLSVWKLADFELLFHVDPEEPAQFQTVSISPDHTILVTGENKHLRFWKLSQGDLISSVPVDAMISDVKFKSDERLITANAYLGNVQEWDVSTRTPINQFNFTKPVITLRISADAKLVLVDYGQRGFELWNTETGEIQHAYGDIISASGWQRLSGNNRYVVVWGFTFNDNSSMSLWDLETHVHTQEFSTPMVNGDGWRCGALNADGSILAASNNEGYVYFYKVSTGEKLGEVFLPYKFK